MSDVEDAAADLAAAASVWAATLELDGAIADLAARPLDEGTAERVRDVLSGANMREARGALQRLEVRRPTRRPRLSVVGETRHDEDQPGAQSEDSSSCAGGVA